MPVPKEQAVDLLTQYVAKVIHYCLGQITGEKAILEKIKLINSIIDHLDNIMEREDLSEDLLDQEALILKAILSKTGRSDDQLKNYINKNYSLTGYSFSTLFTGSNSEFSLDSELSKEILTSDHIYWIVSFIRWTGVRILEKELKAFTSREGVSLKIITTTYMGASEPKAIEFLASLPNTEIKISYNTHHERLHAKSYIFKRNSGFDTAYIGSSNMSYAALTKGLEWNLKINAQENKHLVDKSISTFHTYWENRNFQSYDNSQRNKLIDALNIAKGGGKTLNHQFVLPDFEIQPYAYQTEILEKLEFEREVLGNSKNLVVAATGTGKTIISALDFKRFKLKNDGKTRIMFVAHREEILLQALSKFKGVLREPNFGDLWVGSHAPSSNYNEIFVSIQTLKNQQSFFKERFQKDFFDYIVIDEAHHGAARSYQFVFDYFTPKILLGLTATPERMDGQSLLPFFSNKIAASIRLPDALKLGLLSPFQYFCITDHDSVDLSKVSWKGKYDSSELDNLYTGNHYRVNLIIDRLNHYCSNLSSVRGIGFCNSIEHAKFMSDQFNHKGLKSKYLVSGNGIDKGERLAIKEELETGKINYVFVKDIYNEGVDIPCINTVLFLRPTESLTVFLQQLGRGLRLSEGKECLTVLDFVGQANTSYQFSDRKFKSLLGRGASNIETEIIEGFPHVPFGSSIYMEEKAQEFILKNIRDTIYNTRRIQVLLRDMMNQGEELSLYGFLIKNDIKIQELYKGNNTWGGYLHKIGYSNEENDRFYEQIVKNTKRLLHVNSSSYLNWIEQFLLNRDTKDEGFCTMLYYDIWQKPVSEWGFDSIESGLLKLLEYHEVKLEILDIVRWLKDNLSQRTYEIDLGYKLELEVYARYSRDEILSSFRLHNAEKKYSSREGVLNVKSKDTELLFVTLDKSSGTFSSTTSYEDYAISEKIFHWQSQNSARPDRGVGLSYINHQKKGKKILLFVREKTKDEYGFTMPFHFLGPVNYVSHSGMKPMSINWELENKIPAALWEYAGKLSHG